MRTTRSRKVLGYKTDYKYSQEQRTGSGPITDVAGSVSSGTYEANGRQITVSEGHPFHSRKGPKGLDDVGGDFFTLKSYIKGKPRYVTAKGPWFDVPFSGGKQIRDSYRGSFQAADPNAVGFPPDLSSSDTILDKLGATAIANCAPGNPPANVVTFLGELLRDGLPSMAGAEFWESKTKAAKAAGSEYLNLQFGWAPLVNDVRSLSNAVLHAESIIDQLERDAGKVVRRRMQLPTQQEVSSTTITPAQAFTAGVSFRWGDTSNRTLTRIRTVERRRWFSGAFTYYLPSDYESRNALRSFASRAELLLGTNLTPESLWELTPWSWAIDWFTNTGDVLKNIQRFATGGLVMRYGYVMEHTIVTDTYTLDGSGINSPVFTPVPPLILVTEIKKRRGANPFGFGVTWNGISSFQASIAAALGLSRK